MGALMVWTDATYEEMGATHDFYLDLECGTDTGESGNNTFSAPLPDDVMLEAGCALFVDGTQWGGVVDRRTSDTDVDGIMQWEGRTWHGILAEKALVPDSGQAYNTASGSVAACIADLITRLDVGDLFAVGDCPSETVSYQYPRYPDGLTALFKMLASVDMRPTFEPTREGGILKVNVGAVGRTTHGDIADGEMADMEMTAELRPYNHVLALGKGELTQRVVVNRYADANGNISTSKTFTGCQERTIIYEDTNSEEADLIERAIELLQDAQGQSEVAVTPDSGMAAGLGDYIIAYDQRIDARVTAPITALVVKIDDGTESVDCTAGGA